jgi:PAS domain S-box-containing protein
LELNIQDYTFSPLFFLLIIGGFIGVITFIYLLKFRKSREVQFWLIWQIAASWWAFTYAFEYAGTTIETKIFWSKLSYFGIVYEATSFLFFALSFSSMYKYLERKYVFSAYALATLFIVFPFTNEYHHLHWEAYSVNPLTNGTDYQYGPTFWALVAYTYLQLLGGIIIVFRLFFRLSGYYRRQVLIIFVSALLPLLGNFIYVFHINPLPGFDWTPFTFLITGILIAVNITRFRMFNLVPFARNQLIDIIPDAILIVDKSLIIADCNHAFSTLIGKSENEIIGKSVFHFFPTMQELIQEILRHDRYRTELLGEMNEKKKYFDLQVNALYDHKKLETGRLVILKDITRRVESEELTRTANARLTEEIQEKEKLIQDLDAFSHTVAHDLKGMLGSIVSASNLIQTGIEDMSKEDLLEVVDLISQSANKTTQITRELLTLASVRQQEIVPVPVDMELVSKESLIRLKDLISEKKAQIVMPENWYKIMGYKAWIEEVLVNYISNALKYGGTPPLVKICIEIVDDDKVKFSVFDNGKGLSSEEMTLLFKKFSRLDTLRAEGHGLGLSIVKRIVEKLGGEVGVESENIPGEGCVFYFILPLAR